VSDAVHARECRRYPTPIRKAEPICEEAVEDEWEETLGESRWPPAGALVLFIALTVAVRLWLPRQSAVRLPWPVPSLEVALLLALVAGDPARMARRAHVVRRIAVAIVLVAAALWSTAVLVYDLMQKTGVSQSPS
jgi:hypothetical protein